MGLFDRKRTTLGLDIGRGWVKLARMNHAGDRPELLAVASRRVPPGAVADGRIARPEELTEAIDALLGDAGSASRDVNIALGGHDVFVKRARVPKVGGSQANAAIRREAERHVPFDLQGVHLDHQVLDMDADEASMDVLLVAAKRETIDRRVALLAQAGARVGVLDVEALALCNCLVHNYPVAAQGVVVLVNIGHEAINVVVLEDGVPALIRDLPLGLARFGELLEQVHGLPSEWADEVVHGRRPLDGLDRAVETAADVVAVGIERACALLRTQRPGAGVGRMFLSGGGACVAGVARVLGRRMKVETAIANPCERVAIAPGVRGRRSIAGAPSLYFQAIGLALRAA